MHFASFAFLRQISKTKSVHSNSSNQNIRREFLLGSDEIWNGPLIKPKSEQIYSGFNRASKSEPDTCSKLEHLKIRELNDEKRIDFIGIEKYSEK